MFDQKQDFMFLDIMQLKEWKQLLNVFVSLTVVTFEDRRKANFDKGQAELEKRRLALQEQRKQEEEARLAAERAEQEKRERIRYAVYRLSYHRMSNPKSTRWRYLVCQYYYP